ncbi:hypothetical protein JD793_004698 [Citrobacter braakii]|nr:hypothetical protein [Citrobacter braakii]
MSDKDFAWWQSVVQHVSQHRLGWFTGGSAFFAAIWAGLLDGNSLARSAFGGVICVLIALGIVSVMQTSGMYQAWMPLAGIFVGFIGAERIRDTVLAAWDSRKERVVKGKRQ